MEELEGFIKDQLKKGIGEPDIRTVLTSEGGWTREDLDNAFGNVQNTQNTNPITQAPKPSMNSKNKLITSALIAVALVIAGIVGAYFIVNQKDVVEPIACTAEAKLCPDGSSVGRTGPNCEFTECPNIPDNEENEYADWKTYQNPLYMIRYPKEWVIDLEFEPNFIRFLTPERFDYVKSDDGSDHRVYDIQVATYNHASKLYEGEGVSNLKEWVDKNSNTYNFSTTFVDEIEGYKYFIASFAGSSYVLVENGGKVFEITVDGPLDKVKQAIIDSFKFAVQYTSEQASGDASKGEKLVANERNVSDSSSLLEDSTYIVNQYSPITCSDYGEPCDEIVISLEVDLTEGGNENKLVGNFYIRGYVGVDKIAEKQITEHYDKGSGDFENRVWDRGSLELSLQAPFDSNFYLTYFDSLTFWLASDDSPGYGFVLINATPKSSFNGRILDFYYKNENLNIGFPL